MAISARTLLYDWFGITLRKPTHQQFRNWIDSFWHKEDDTIPISAIENLSATLAAKADNEYVVATVNAAVTGLLDDRGNWNPNDEEWPTNNGSGYGGNILKGDIYFVSADGTLDGIEFKEGDTVRALIDGAGQVPSDWGVMRKNAVSSASPVWGGIGGDIGNQSDLVTLLNLFAHYNLIIETNTTTPTGVLAGYAEFVSAFIGDNPNLVVKSYIIDGFFVRVNCTGLKTLSAAFNSSTELVSINDSSGIKILTTGCFANCATLTNVSFQYVERVESLAFNDCSNLVGVNMPMVSIIDGGYVFNGTKLITAYFPLLISLGAAAFFQLTTLESICLPSLQIIGDDAFNGCTQINNLVLPSVIQVGSSAFANCSGLAIVMLPVALTINSYAFDGCLNVNKIFIPSCIEIAANAFNACDYLTNLVVLESSTAVTNIETINVISARILAN